MTTSTRDSTADSIERRQPSQPIPPFDGLTLQERPAGKVGIIRLHNVLADNHLSVEFRCRLASPNGEIVEGVYVAENEAKLRHELEEKGLYVLSMQPKGAIAGVSLRLPQSSRVNPREFLIFNQELATLLKAGMPLVQSLDLLKQRV